MTLEEALFSWASAQTELQSLLGEPDRLRFYKLQVPKQSRMPATVIQRAGTGRQVANCGTVGTVSLTLQVDHYAKSWDAMNQVAEAFRIALHAQEFPVMMGTVKVKAATLTNEFDLDDPEPGLYRRSQSWSFWFVE